MVGQDIPSPLPFVVSILPLLLSSADVTLPPATLSTSVLQRHYYLSSSSDSPSTYLQATSDAPIQDAVESRRETLASTWLEDVKPSEILYSATIHEEQKLVARIKLSVTSSTSEYDDGSLVLLVVYEEAASPPDNESGSSGVSAAAGSSSLPAAKEDEEEESGWKYYDLQLPQSRLNMNTSAWHICISDAKAALARQIPSTSTDTRAHRSASVSTSATTTKKSPTTAAQKALREKQREADAARGLGVEEGPDQDPDDYWAGCESSEDEGGNKSEVMDDEIGEDDEDDYWNNYGQTSPGNSGSIVDSGHHEHDQPPEDDHTLRYDHDNSESVGHFEYARELPASSEGLRHGDYSFEAERNEEAIPVTGGRILVEESNLRDNRTTITQDFLSTLQSSLERVSSSQSEESQSDNDLPDGAVVADMPINGHMNGNGHAHPERPPSPTIDSAISKSIAGLWETYLLSSALGGGGKSREIAAYEFMELVQTVVLGEPS